MKPCSSLPSAKVLRFSRYASMPFITYYHCNVGQDPRPISNVGLAFRRMIPPCFYFEFQFHYSTFHSNTIVIVPFVQAACSTSRRTTLATASRPRITRPSPSLSPQRRIDCSTSSSCTCWKIFTPPKASAPSNSPVPTQNLSRRRSSVSTL